MSLAATIKSNPLLKKIVHRMLIPANEHRPRQWVKMFVNPFKHKKGKCSVIRRRTRIDVLPFNDFQLGAYSVIEDFATVNNGVGNVIIGSGTTIGIGNVIIGPVTIGNNVILAQNIVVSGLNHGYEDIKTPPSLQKVSVNEIKIADDVWIGANAVITAGVSIGKHAVIGAGSVVTKNIPSYSLAVGNPARVIKQFDFSINEWVKVSAHE